MIEPLIYCKVCGMTMQCIADFYKEFGRRPVVLEIGCADGQGTMRYAGFCERVICVDPMVAGRPDIWSRDKGDFQADAEKLSDFRRRTQDFPVKLVQGCSLWKETVEEVQRELSDQKVDILVIDGCHHPYEAVLGDFQTYYPFVMKGGYIVFDDLYEEHILKVYEDARDRHGMLEHDRFAIRTEHVLQDCAALKKTEE